MTLEHHATTTSTQTDSQSEVSSTSTNTSYDADLDQPALPTISDDFRLSYESVFAAIAKHGYDTSQGEPPFSTSITTMAQATDDTVRVDPVFRITVDWEVDKPFGMLGDREVDLVFESPSGMQLNLVRHPAGETSVWLRCGDGVASLSSFADADDSTFAVFIDDSLQTTCA